MNSIFLRLNDEIKKYILKKGKNIIEINSVFRGSA
jgi:hypothetical protein